MLVSRALELGMTLRDLDDIDISFIIEIAEQRNVDNNNEEEIIEATPEMLGSFFV